MNNNDNKTVKAYTLRINTEIFNRVKELARVNKRSIAKEIEFILEQYFKTQN